MTAEMPRNGNHIVDLLPAYANGRLDPLATRRVQEHLLHCAMCRTELATWEAIRDVTQFAASSTPLPSASVLEQAMAQIDAQVARPVWQQTLKRMLTHFWLVLTRQVPVIHKSIWYITPLVILFGCVLALIGPRESVIKLHSAEIILSLFITVVGAAGVAFIFGSENDAGFELTLATPTSMRAVMLSRVALVLGYNIALAALASALVTLVHGGGLWGVVQLWLGPLILLTSVSLVLSLTIGSVFALVASLILEVIQALAVNVEQGMVAFQLSHSNAWQTNPAMLLIAVLLIGFAVFYAPRKIKLPN
jgi:hypothetical protein